MVMGLLFKKLLRDIREAKGQFLSIILVIVIGVMFFISLNSALRNLEFAGEKYFRDYRLADLWAVFQKAPENVLDLIKSFPEVEQVTGRVVRDQQITIGKRDAVIRLITLPDKRSLTVNDVMLKSGRYFSDDESSQCLVDEAFFKAHGLRFGDYLEPVINGNQAKIKVIGVAKSPEFIYQLRDSSEIIPDPARFGIIYIKRSFGQAVLDFNGSVNDVSILLKPGTDSDQVRLRMERALQRYGLIEIYSKEEQLSYNMFTMEIEQLSSLSGVFPVLFLIAAATIIYITMNRIIENQRTQIGTLKALGYSNLQIMAHYLSYAACAGLAGNALGAPAGIYLGEKIMMLYNTIYQLPPAQTETHYDLIVPALLLTMFFCILAGYNSCKNELRLIPAESMRPKAPKAGVKTWLERMDFLWRRLNFSWKIIFRNLSRYKKRAALTSVGIIFATALLLTALGLNDCIGFLMEQQFSTMQKYDLKVTFNRMLAPAELNYIRSLPQVSRLEPQFQTGVELRNGWRVKKTGLIGLTQNSRLQQVTDRSGRVMPVPAGGILIPEMLSQSLDAGAGDLIQVKPLWPGRNRDRDQRLIRVKGVVAQYIGQSIYCQLDFCGQIFGEGPMANVALITLNDPQRQSELVARLKKMPAVNSVQSLTDTVANIKKTLENQIFSIIFMILASGLLAFAVIYNITTINIFERRRELATLKVLGFTNSEMRQSVFNENLIITSLSIGCGLILGRYLLNYLSREWSTDTMSVPAVLNSPSYLLTILLILAFNTSANLLLMRKVHAINMVEALKSSE